MLHITSGVAAVAASFGGMWYFKPRRGVVHPLVTKPFFGSTIVIIMMGVFAMGVAMIIDGFY
jgi:hypothetical protein